MNKHKLRNERLKERLNPSANEGMKAQALWPQPQSGSWGQCIGEGQKFENRTNNVIRSHTSEMPNGETWLTFHGHSSSGILLV